MTVSINLSNENIKILEIKLQKYSIESETIEEEEFSPDDNRASVKIKQKMRLQLPFVRTVMVSFTL